jgi:hypothetical protein
VAEVRKQVPLDPIMAWKIFHGSFAIYRSEENLSGPILTVHFEGADVVLTPMHTFIPPEDGIFRFAVHASNSIGGLDGFGAYGNFAQSNFLIGYDMENMMLSFKQTDCTK